MYLFDFYQAAISGYSLQVLGRVLASAGSATTACGLSVSIRGGNAKVGAENFLPRGKCNFEAECWDRPNLSWRQVFRYVRFYILMLYGWMYPQSESAFPEVMLRS